MDHLANFGRRVIHLAYLALASFLFDFVLLL